MKKNLRRIKTNKEAEKLLENDFSPYINIDNFKKTSFEFQAKDKTVTMRLSANLLQALKDRSKKEGISYQKLMRQALEKFLAW